MTVRDDHQLVGSVVDGYRVVTAVAEGGFGVVYRAVHQVKGREVALKLLKLPSDAGAEALQEFRDAFKREALLLARIRHPNLVEIFDIGETDLPTGRAPWMALEWLEGVTLRQQLLARRGTGGRTPAEAIALLRPVFDALAQVHAEGIAHRDLKPANIIMANTRRGVIPKVIDLGIARPMEAGARAGSGVTQTVSSMQAFSLSYAAPEQVGGTRTGPWTDVHALALILTEVLVDLPPYPGRDRAESMQRVMISVRPTPKVFGRDVGSLQLVLERALALRPADRYPDAGTFLAEIDKAIEADRNRQLHDAEEPEDKTITQWNRSFEQSDADGFGMDTLNETRLLGDDVPLSNSIPNGELKPVPTGRRPAVAPQRQFTPIELIGLMVGLSMAFTILAFGLAARMQGGERSVAAVPTLAAPPAPVPVLHRNAQTSPLPPTILVLPAVDASVGSTVVPIAQYAPVVVPMRAPVSRAPAAPSRAPRNDRRPNPRANQAVNPMAELEVY